MATAFWDAVHEEEDRRMTRRLVYDPWVWVAPGKRIHALELFAVPEMPSLPGGFLTPFTYPG